MGGAIGLAIVTTVMNQYIQTHLSGILTLEQLHELLRSTRGFEDLPPGAIEVVKKVFAGAFNLQMRILIGTSAAQIPLSLLLWQKKQIIV
jgi:hypothetical protein